ncbi:MAG: mercury methylation corrinoid protein HgcA [Thermodesulfovibrionales bacterium]|nr:mercury methylation corrinoid protein HgcA [Thermodesulfovibrionales bacterium]
MENIKLSFMPRGVKKAAGPPSFSRVSADWTQKDFWGQIKCRVSSFRMRYSVKPGLYAVGEPDGESDVFVTANYKLSFDILRRELKGLNAWILVLDTKGINVWCAAGKGTFGTNELINRINETGLHSVVTHRKIIIPQLGAVGVNAKSVAQKTGFRVYFGPVHAKDIPAYIRGGYVKTPEMRLVRFDMIDRLVLTPMEINPAMKKFPLFGLVILLLFGMQPSGILFKDAWEGGMPFLIFGLTAVFSGAFITPLLLPFIPFRSFAVKGWLTGIIAVFALMKGIELSYYKNLLPAAAVFIFFPFASSYIALQFTGSTTFTSMSGVKKELKIGVPVYLTATALSLLLLIVYKLFQWKII